MTPWGTWLTCEETETKAGASGGAITKDHGWVFEVDPARPANNIDPTPLTGLGRFAHEAVVVDPQRGHLYLTEDASGPNGLVYRFTPNDRRPHYGALRAGGTLDAMTCSDGGTHVPDLSVYTEPGTELSVAWIVVPDPLATTTSIRKQFTNDQVTRSRKFEGTWWAGGRAYIVCSFARLSDGSAAEHDGQVWSYDPKSGRLRLEVRFEVNADPDSDAPDGPDNITVSPYGGLFLAEDGEGVQHLFGVTPDGASYPFARNALNTEEFTGVCFAPDRQTMFANMQTPGITFAIIGTVRGAHAPVAATSTTGGRHPASGVDHRSFRHLTLWRWTGGSGRRGGTRPIRSTSASRACSASRTLALARQNGTESVGSCLREPRRSSRRTQIIRLSRWICVGVPEESHEGAGRGRSARPHVSWAIPGRNFT